MSPTIAIVGATGAVGQELIALLGERPHFRGAKLRLLASSRTSGQRIVVRGGSLTVAQLTKESFGGADLALFAAGGEVSRRFVDLARRAGALVIDNSSAFRLDPEVPLVVPEVNPDALRDHGGIIANPNCSTILLALPLGPLHAAAGVERVVVSTYQAASGAGIAGVDDLRRGLEAYLADRPDRPEALPHSLAANVFPRIDRFGPEGYTLEEDKMLFETRKIFGLAELPVEATCVRVPVERCHAESVTVDLQRPLSPDEAREILRVAPGLELVDDPEHDLFPQPVAFAGRDRIGVGRIRRSRIFPGGLTFWLVGDQLRKGAALNAVQIAERLDFEAP